MIGKIKKLELVLDKTLVAGFILVLNQLMAFIRFFIPFFIPFFISKKRCA